MSALYTLPKYSNLHRDSFLENVALGDHPIFRADLLIQTVLRFQLTLVGRSTCMGARFWVSVQVHAFWVCKPVNRGPLALATLSGKCTPVKYP